MTRPKVFYGSSLQSQLARLFAATASLVAFAHLATAQSPAPAIMPATPTIQYPSSPAGDVVDIYHGRKVADPFRWLEDVESEKTEAWVKAQNEVTQSYLSKLPSRGPMRDRLEELWNYARYDLPVQRGGKYFFTHNDGLQNQSVLYVAPADTPAEQITEQRTVLIDPNTLSEDGTIALGSWHPSDDGRLLAYSIADGGSDWRTWRVRDVASRRDMDDVVRWSKFSGIAWTPEGDGFYYARYAEPTEGEELTGTNENQMLYLHRLGTPQEDDTLVYARPDEPQWGFSPTVTDDGRYLVIENWKGTQPKTQVFIRDLHDDDAGVQQLISGFDADYHFFASLGSTLYFLTDLEAPRRRVIAIDAANVSDASQGNEHCDRSQWRSIIAQTDDTLENVSLLGETIYASYLSDALSKVVRYSLAGQVMSEVELPGNGSATGFGGRQEATETFFSFSNYVTPPSLHRVDVATGKTTLWLQPKVPFDVNDYVTEQVFCTSKDGTRVPILITRHRNQRNDGSNRTLLYAYGGFNISLTPAYSPAIAAWLDNGGVYAVANLRGGGEYGSEWHEAGMRLNKQNVFDDFIAAAEHLIHIGITRREKLAIRGGSNGGLLVGAVMTQRPDLFAACLPAVGVMDMLRYHKFTIGWAWASEFGSSEEADQIDNLLSYSPLHNLKAGTCYPATLITTADRDDRVVPGHSFKFAAALQAAQGCDKPVLIRIETRAGHGAGTPTSKKIDEYADLWSFLIENM